MTTVATAPAGLTFRSSQGRWVLVATVLGSGLAAIDATVVGIALPAMGKDFDVDLAALQWVVTAYTLTLAGLLLVGGALGDRFGRRTVFVIGVVGFAAASLLCGIAPDIRTLIAARALQGVGGALLTPGSLAILQASFTPEDRGKAIGAWSGLGGVATALGPFLGGWLIETASWRLIFYINLPLAALVVWLAVRHVPETRDPQADGPVDALGGALVTVALVGITYGLITGPGAGWTAPEVLIGLLGGAALGVAFVVRERRTGSPILPLELFRSRGFTVTNLVTFVVYGALGGVLFLLPIQLQQVGGFSAVAAGVSLLPVTLIMLLLSTRSGALAARIGPRWQMSIGPVVTGLGLVLLVRVGADAEYAKHVLPAVVVLGLGLSIVVAPLTATVLAAAPAEHAGAASAVNNDVARAAGLIAVAVLPAAAGIGGSAYLQPGAFDAGFDKAVMISGVLCVLGGLLSLVALPSRRPARIPAPRPAPRSTAHCGLDAPPLCHEVDH